jgi:hypothetical protein
MFKVYMSNDYNLVQIYQQISRILLAVVVKHPRYTLIPLECTVIIPQGIRYQYDCHQSIQHPIEIEIPGWNGKETAAVTQVYEKFPLQLGLPVYFITVDIYAPTRRVPMDFNGPATAVHGQIFTKTYDILGIGTGRVSITVNF